MSALNTLVTDAVKASMIGSLVAKVRENGIKDMIVFFVGVHEVYPGDYKIIMHPEVVALGRELLERLAKGEDIDPLVIHVAMNRNSVLHSEVLAVPFERYQDHVPTLVRLVAPCNYVLDSDFSERRRRSLERLEELHRSGTRLSYEDIRKIVGGAFLWRFGAEPPTYFLRLLERVGKKRAHRRLDHAWAHYCCSVVREPKQWKVDHDHLQAWVMGKWSYWARQPFKEACNKIFDRMMTEHRPFPNVGIISHH